MVTAIRDKQFMIIIFQRILPDYRTGFFRKFAFKFKNSKILYGQPFKGESLRNDELKDDNTFIKVKNTYFSKVGAYLFRGYLNIISESKPEVVISVFNTGNLNIYLLFLLRRNFTNSNHPLEFRHDPVQVSA